VLSARGLCVGLITRTEESYWVWVCLSVIVNTQEWGDPGTLGGCSATKKNAILPSTSVHVYINK